MVVTSLKNELIKKLAKIKNSKDELFLVESAKLCDEAVKCNLEIKYCLFCDDEFSYITDKLSQSVKIKTTPQIIEKLSSLKTPQNILIYAKRKNNEDFAIQNNVFILDGVSDPGNMGAILRSFEAFGYNGVYCSKNCVDKYNPKTLRSAMGSAFRVKSKYVDLKDLILNLKNKGYTVVSTDMQGLSIDEYDFNNKTAIVIGNEANGVSKEILSLCDKKITIKMQGENESLNAAVATSIIAWESSKINKGL